MMLRHPQFLRKYEKLWAPERDLLLILLFQFECGTFTDGRV